jgi:hypothetical protein
MSVSDLTSICAAIETCKHSMHWCSSHGVSALQGDERLAACLLYFPELTEFAPSGRAYALTLPLLSL